MHYNLDLFEMCQTNKETGGHIANLTRNWPTIIFTPVSAQSKYTSINNTEISSLCVHVRLVIVFNCCLVDGCVAGNVEQDGAPPTMCGVAIAPAGLYSIMRMFPTDNFVTTGLLVR